MKLQTIYQACIMCVYSPVCAGHDIFNICYWTRKIKKETKKNGKHK